MAFASSQGVHSSQQFLFAWVLYHFLCHNQSAVWSNSVIRRSASDLYELCIATQESGETGYETRVREVR